MLNDLLEVPYHHLVLAVPAHLRGVLSFNRPGTLNLLVGAATAALSQWAREQQGMRRGIVAVLHTFGSDLKWHPHLHLLVTEGGLSLDASRWVRPYGDGWLVAHGALKKMWRYHVIRALRRAHRAGELRFSKAAAFLADYPRFNALLRRLYDPARSGQALQDGALRRPLRHSLAAALPRSRPPRPRPEPAGRHTRRRRHCGLPSPLGRAAPDPLQCPTCRISLQFVRLVFGPHEPIAELFRAAGKPLRPSHPAWDTG